MKEKKESRMCLGLRIKTSKILGSFVALGLMAVLAGCGATEPWYDSSYDNWRAATPPDTSEIEYSVWLIGDVGDPDLEQTEPSLQLMMNQMYTNRYTTVFDSTTNTYDTILIRDSDPNGAVIYLGDNIYYEGLPPETDDDYPEKAAVLVEQLKVVEHFKGQKIFIPGNHDWAEMRPEGWEWVMRQERFVEAYLDSIDAFQPTGGCPGPVELHLSNNLVLIILDSQWWLHKWDKPMGEDDGCTAASELEIIVQLDDIVERNLDKHIVLVQHHPIFSNSSHGGHYSFIDYMFPLTLLRDNLWIPLPIIGSTYPWMRQYGITRQDIPNPTHQRLKKGILSVVEDKPNVIMATGHDHNLQMTKYNEFHHIISGSGCKENYVSKGRDQLFTYAEEGFVRLNYYTSGEVWAEFWTPIEAGDSGTLAFRTPLYALYGDEEDDETRPLPDYRDSAITTPASTRYGVTGLTEFLLGSHYRDVWETPITVEYLDLKRDYGGLTPVALGGGKQTISLRLKDTSGIEYQLRSIDKNPAVLPENLQEVFVNDLVQDQISAAHPYGALTIPPMADAIGIYHTDPRLVYVPRSPRLGPYIDDVGGMLAIIEVRPDEDLSKFPRFGNSENVVSTSTLYEHLYDDNDNEVDQQMFLKNRLFDIIIGDWDRHEDQWRWAEFEKEDKGSVFRPVPRDRDQVFYKFDGVLPYLFNRKWGFRHIRNFGSSYSDIIGLTMQGVHLDRTLLNELTREDWERMADSIKLLLTDEVIEQAVRQMPEPIFELSGPEIIQKLKSRRDQIDEAAQRYYSELAESVDIVGSDKHEFVLVERLDNRYTRVTMYKKKKEGELLELMYQRTFDRRETVNINIYGLGGMDSFLVTGDVGKALEIRIVGGRGRDVLIDQSRIGLLGQKLKYYDEEENENLIVEGPDTRVTLSDLDYITEYNRTGFQYDYLGPRLFFEYNVDDGLFIGGGLKLTTHGFRKEPYSTEQRLLANYALKTGSFTARYTGHFVSVFGRYWDLGVNAEFHGPKYVLNYFGQGNETPRNQPIEFYRVRMQQLQLQVPIIHNFHEKVRAGFGPIGESTMVLDDANNIISRPEIPAAVTNRKYFGGGYAWMDIDGRDNELFPRRGARFYNELSYLQEISTGNSSVMRFTSDFRWLISPIAYDPLTIGIRLGGAVNFTNNYYFYHSNFLGGSENLRGHRQERYAGKSMFYSNLDARIRIANFSNYVFSGNAGVIGFADAGRVWVPNETSNVWHFGFGPGAYIYLYDLFLVSTHLGFNQYGGKYFSVDFGFFF